MAVTTYKLGRDAIADLPGMANDDIRDVTVTVSADELEVTTFATTVRTHSVYMTGLLDATFDVTCVEHTATLGQRGPATILSLDGLDAIVLDIKESATPKGVAEFTVTYGVIPTDV